MLARFIVVTAVAYLAVVLRPLPFDGLVNGVFGCLLAGVAVASARRLREASPAPLLGALVGALAGLLLARIVEAGVAQIGGPLRQMAFFEGFLLVAFPYVGLTLGAAHGDWLRPARIIDLFRHSAPERSYRVLDTSVIIDGRIADICETGFLDGTLVIPQFVLKELQMVADSSDALKRNRGRRGLDILQRIQKTATVDVTISEVDYPEIKEVDLKLIELARALRGKLVTNDFNLNKVAQLRGIAVLNVNDLANSVKPVVLPGEMMTVFVLKEGKEYNQGVAYLDDGTMVVADNARKMMGKTIDIVVTSVLQTTAGKMIFGRYIEPAGGAPGPAVQAAERTSQEGGRAPLRQQA